MTIFLDYLRSALRVLLEVSEIPATQSVSVQLMSGRRQTRCSAWSSLVCKCMHRQSKKGMCCIGRWKGIGIYMAFTLEALTFKGDWKSESADWFLRSKDEKGWFTFLLLFFFEAISASGATCWARSQWPQRGARASVLSICHLNQLTSWRFGNERNKYKTSRQKCQKMSKNTFQHI